MASLRIAAQTVVRARIAWYHPDQLLQLDVRMVVFHHTAAPTVDKDQTALYQLDLQRDQLKATSICLLVLMEESDQAVRLGQHHRQLVHRPHQLDVLMAEFLLIVVPMADRVLTV